MNLVDVESVVRWAQPRRRYLPIAIDLAIWPVALLLGAFLKLIFRVGIGIEEVVGLSLVAVVLQALLGWTNGQYRGRWRISSFEEVTALAGVWFAVTAVLTTGNYAMRHLGTDLPTSGVMVGCMAAIVVMGLSRGIWRTMWSANRRPSAERSRRTLVFGAGEGGSQIIRAMLHDVDSEYFPIAMLDDDRNKRHREFHGVSVHGDRNDIAAAAKALNADTLLIAIPSASSALIKELTALGADAGLNVRVLPATTELVGRMTLADVRQPTVEDLLGRDPVEIDLGAVADYIRGKRVLITGAGGSIGSELSRQISGFGPAELYLLDRDETALHGLQLSMEGRALLDSDMLVIADIRDRERLFEVFDELRPQVVFHAAALKHVTLLERHPQEGVKTNVAGTQNVIDAAGRVAVERFVNISSDKAADPTSVLGATKLAAERLTAAAGLRNQRPYVSVRFGNVLGSRGSVLPTFLKQIDEGGPVTVTDPEVTRYFMTIPEAVRLVVQAGAIGATGEVLILDMGTPVRIVDLAQQLIDTLAPGTPIEFTGLRQGEKMHERLIGESEIGEVRSHPRITHAAVEDLDVRSALAIVQGGVPRS